MKESLFHQMAEIEAVHWWFQGRRRIVSAMLERSLGNRPHRILEIGCGTGGNLALLDQFGSVEAIEGDPVAREYAVQRGVCPVRPGLLPDDIPVAEGSFDLVILLDVLEHVEPDEASLLRIHGFLAPGGKLLVTVPAMKALWSDHDVAHHHHRRYSRAELSRKLAEAGFVPETVSYFNTILFPLVAGVRFLERVLKRSSESDLSVPPSPLNRLLMEVFSSERFLLGRAPFPFGVSLLALARKGE